MRSAAALVATVLLAGAPSSGQVRFSTRVESVRVDVLATAGGVPVTDLKGTDFEVRDNGTVQQVSLVGNEKAPVNVLLALDTSESLSEERLQRLRAACEALIGKLQPGESAGLITFSDVITVRQVLTTNLRRVSDELARVESGVPADAVVHLAAGLESVLRHGRHPRIRGELAPSRPT